MRESGQGTDGFAGLPSRRSATLLWSLLALLIGVLASVGLARWQHLHEQRMSREVLERNTERAFDALESQVRTATLVVRGVQSVFAASDEVTPSEFQRIFEILSPGQMLAGLQAVAYSRLEGESASDGPVFRVEMVAPAEGNEALFDLDVRDQPDNVRAVWRSRDGDQPVLSSALPLIQYRGAPEPVMGVVLRLPVFSSGPVPRTLRERRARFVGSLAASFRLDQMLGQVVEASLPSDVGLSIVDVSEAQPQPIFQRFSFGSGQPEQGAQGVQREVDVATRTWRLSATFPENRWIPSPTVWAFLTLGVLSSMLLATLVAALLGGAPGSFLNMAAMMADHHAFVVQPFWDWMACLPDPEGLLLHLKLRRWSLDEAPLPQPLFEDVVELLYHRDLFLRGQLRLGGQRLNPALPHPLMTVYDPRSRTVPPSSLMPLHDMNPHRLTRRTAWEWEPGVLFHHLAPVVGRKAHKELWPLILGWGGEVVG